MFDGPVEDRLAIRELHDRYADAVVRVDAGAWGDCWAEDAVWEFMGLTIEGRAAIVDLWTGAMAGFDAVSFVAVPGAIAIDGDRAKGRCQTHEILVEKGQSRVAGGLYEDEFVKRDGRWFYARRNFRVIAEHRPESSNEEKST